MQQNAESQKESTNADNAQITFPERKKTFHIRQKEYGGPFKISILLMINKAIFTFASNFLLVKSIVRQTASKKTGIKCIFAPFLLILFLHGDKNSL